MANITQTIHSLNGGISQQPDEQKIPGQVRDMVNAVPDITQGLLKRPAGKFVSTLTGSTNNGKWFHYYRDENEQYIGQIARNGTVKMWAAVEVKASDGSVIHQQGASIDVVNAIGNNTYLDHTNDDDIQTLTLNDFTYLTNRTVSTEMDTSPSALEPEGDFLKEVYIELKSISYSKQYAVNIFDQDGSQDSHFSTVKTATRINVTLINSSNNYCDSSFYMRTHATRGDGNNARCGEEAGDGRDAFAPNVGTRIFSIDSNKTLTDEGATGGILADSTQSDTNYSYQVNIFKKPVSATYTQNDTQTTVTINSTSHGLSTNDQVQFDFINGDAVDTTKTITKIDDDSFSFTADAPASGNYSGDVSYAVGSQQGRKNLYFRIATTGQSVPYTEGSGNSQTTTYQARYTTTFDLLHGGEGWEEGDYFYVFMKDGYYKVSIDTISISKVQANLALVRPQPTPFDTETTITAESILGDIRSAIIAEGNISASDITMIGTGLHIKRTSNFNASTPVGELLNVIAGKVNDIGDLPSQCKHGMVVEVINSVADEDNHYVKFFGKEKDDGTFMDGEGTWEECAKPGRTKSFKKSSMPVLLIRTADGNFRLTEQDGSDYLISSLNRTAAFFSTTANNTVTVNLTNHGFITDDTVRMDSNFLENGNYKITKIDNNSFSYQSPNNEGNHGTNAGGIACNANRVFFVPQWDDAIVGDDVTNPEPSFIGSPITKMLFFRNRMALLSDENIVMSRPGDFTNFFAKSAIQVIDSDPIDISASSEYPAILFDGIQVNTGLILFTKNQQFMLTTDSDVFSTRTAKINALSTYNFNFKSNPISLGTTIGFLDNAGKHSRFFEMTQVQREGEPQVIEQSAVVSKLFEDDLKLISNSRENSIVLFSEEDNSTLYGYKYFDQIRDRKLASWFRWTLPGNIKYHCMQDDSLFVVLENNENDSQRELLKFSIRMDSNTFALEGNRIHLDYLMETNSWTYDSVNNKSTLTKPSGLNGVGQLAAYNSDGSYGKITVNGNTLELEGNWQGQTFQIGYLYTMSITLPTIYYILQQGEQFKADTRSNTILHRVKLGFGPVGVYETTLSRKGRKEYTEIFEVTPANNVLANTAGIFDDNVLRTVPIYDRNINTSLTIKSTHPSPATLHNLTWEGVYSNNFYERV